MTAAGQNQVEKAFMISIFFLFEKQSAAPPFTSLHISAACKTLACKCVFTCVCLCVTVSKKQCFSTEPHGAEPCQHSRPQLPAPAPVLSHEPAAGIELAKYSALLSWLFLGKLLLSQVSPHKPLNTSSSTANGLQQCEGNVYNYTWIVQ